MTVTDDELRQVAEEAATRRVAELGFEIKLERAVHEGRVLLAEQELYRELHHEDPQAAEEILRHRWAVAA